MSANNSFSNLLKTQPTTRWCPEVPVCPQAQADSHRNHILNSSSTHSNSSPCLHLPQWDSAITLKITEANNNSSSSTSSNWFKGHALRRTTTTRASSSNNIVQIINGEIPTKVTSLRSQIAAVISVIMAREITTLSSIPLSIINSSNKVPRNSNFGRHETAAT